MSQLTRASICFLLSIIVVVFAFPTQGSGEKPTQSAAAMEQLLGELSQNTEIPPILRWKSNRGFYRTPPPPELGYVFDMSGLRFAAKAKQGDKWVLVVDGKERGVFDGIESILMGSDGENVVYSAKRSGKWIKMLNEKELGQAFDELRGGVLGIW
jgi:hypothetical protein